MKITFLGTSSGLPTLQRNVTSIALSLSNSSEVWLFDCGEGTQQQILKISHLTLNKIHKIFITHMHGDHVYGLLGLISTMNLLGINHQLDIYGPKELAEFTKHALANSFCHLKFNAQFHTVQSGTIFDDERICVKALPLKHSIEAHGFRVEEKAKSGHFALEKAQADGIPPGRIYQQLKNKEIITLPDGRTIKGVDYLGPDIAGKIITYCSDTTYCENSVKLAENAAVLIHEATYLSADVEAAERHLHSTVAMAAEVAKKAGVRTLILTHFSQRYAYQDPAFLQDARVIFPNEVLAAFDGFEFTV